MRETSAPSRGTSTRSSRSSSLGPRSAGWCRSDFSCSFSAGVRVRRGRSWTFVPAAAGLLLLVRPLTDHHLVLLSVACAISAGPSLALAIAPLPRIPQVLATSALVLLVAAGLYQEQRRLHRNDLPDPPEVTWAVEALERATGPGELVVTDQPIVLFRTGRSTFGPLIDISDTRVSGGTLTAAEVSAEIRRTRPNAVLVDRMLRFLPPVIELLDRRYPWHLRCRSATLYLATRPRAPPACPSSGPGRPDRGTSRRPCREARPPQDVTPAPRATRSAARDRRSRP